MDPKITASLITAVAAITAPIVTWIVQNLSFSPISDRKKRVLKGSWRGVTKQASVRDGTLIEVDLVIDFKTRWRRISGKSRVKGGGDELDIAFTGGYKELDHVFLEYSSKTKYKVNFGCAILKLNGNGDTLHGKVIGYGNMSDALISGDMTLKKI